MRVHFLLTLLVAVLPVASCGSTEEKKEEPKKEAAPSGCDIDMTKLAGSAWVHLKATADGSLQPNPQARLRFRDNAGALEADYTAASLGDVYKYECKLAGNIATCVEADEHLDAWCKAYAASHDGVCDPAAVGAALGIPAEKFKDVAIKVNKELKGLSKAETEVQRKVDNSPNNKIRAKFLVALNKGTCQLTLQDKYQTMVNGKLNEFENVLGAAPFGKATEEYFWTTCKDADNTKAPGPDGQHLIDQAMGTVKFVGSLGAKVRPDPGCTYTADVWRDWVKLTPDVPAAIEKGQVTWTADVPLTSKGLHAVYFDRKKTCGDKVEVIGPTCATVRVQ